MLVTNCIKITDINNENYQLFRNSVSEERRIRADRFYFINDSQRSICSELLLQYSLFQVAGQFVNLDVDYNEFGKPFMKYIKEFSYNLSHSGKWVAITYGSNDVGVDIEEIQQENDNIVDKFFTEEEKCFINKVEGKERAKRFTQIWTLKESYMKYLGTGFSTRMNSFSVNALSGVVTSENGKIQKELRLNSYLFDTNYYLSVCSVEEEVTIHEIRLEDMIQFIDKCKKRRK